jgi:hypothetical protein
MESSNNSASTLARARKANMRTPKMRIRRKYLTGFNNSDILEVWAGNSLSIQLIGPTGAILLATQNFKLF